MSNFFARARERAQGVVSNPMTPQEDGYVLADSSTPSGYWDRLPAKLRQTLAHVDPRYDGTRALHVLLTHFKTIVGNNEALARSYEESADAFEHFGADQIAGRRQDNVGDHVLTDMCVCC